MTQEEIKDFENRLNISRNAKDIKALMEEIYKKYPDNPLNEMAQDICEFSMTCARYEDSIHFNIANIICLTDYICEDNLLHWRSELLAAAKKIICANTEKQVKKKKLVLQNILPNYMTKIGNDLYTYADSYIYEEAMLYEIKKACKDKSTKRQQTESMLIKKYVLPNIEKFVEPNKKRVEILFQKFLCAVDCSSIKVFEDAVDEFINTEVIVDIF